MIFDPRQTVEPQPSAARRTGEVAIQRVPSLRILFHQDLRRVGMSTRGDVFERPGVPIDVGRLTPNFYRTWERDPQPKALDDPCVSRRQMTIAWRPEQERFEVTPSPSAGLTVQALVPDPARDGDLASVPMAPRYLLAPGSLLAIGDRILLRLCYERYRGPDDDRLHMIGESEAIWDLRDRIQTVSRFRESILIAGETGSGKERVAEALHEASQRTGIFLAINMSRINPNLADSELFGHVKGAFSGADRDKAGAFEVAEGGTLFLDEIADVPLDVQRKLLRVLENRSFSRLGSSKVIEGDVRIVAATNKALGPEFEAGRFRYDLFERLRALQVSVPALRHRREDIPLLFSYFLALQSEEHPELAWLWPHVCTADEPPIPMSFMIELLHRPWPGNVRELRNRVTATAAANIAGGPIFTPPPADEAFLDSLQPMNALNPSPSAHPTIAPSLPPGSASATSRTLTPISTCS
ncbi:MAG: sigma 54-interacting transcriptional regulator [Myxococcota bacterium]